MSSLQDRIGLHSWTLDTTPLADVLRIAREAGYNAVELRHIDFKRCIESGTIFARGDEQRRLFDSMDQMCARAAALDCEVMMIGPDSSNNEGSGYTTRLIYSLTGRDKYNKESVS